ncbi:hypothetical protein [uncultured Clostridium sp.]|uniref:hypothetical protein n=1 Tax=uncultured Clostridium sp. TaxID=59620 RepID=UPI0028EB18CC|nr:hypothetical protein [uncultured Clostridium sp.]
MRNKILSLTMLIMLVGNFTGCGKNDTQNNNPSVTSQANQSQESKSKAAQDESNSTNEVYNKFFFKDVSSKNQYTYKGTIWGRNVLDQRNENVDGEGGIYVKADLTVSHITKLSKGNIYELDFSVKGDKNNTKEKDESLYLWVTEDTIYSLSPSSNTDDKELYENGQFSNLKYSKKLETTDELPSTDKSVILCSNDDMNFTNAKWKTKIQTENNICTYDSYNDGDSSYTKFVWKAGTGLTDYSLGYGARAAGMDLHLVE